MTVQERVLEHWVSREPFNPYSIEAMTPEQERFYRASQWQMMWWKFRRHKIAVLAGWILLLFYASILVSEVLAPYNLQTRDAKHIYAPPQLIHLFDTDGHFVGPFVYGYDFKLDMKIMKRVFTADPSKIDRIRFFCFGDSYHLWGMLPGSFHLMCPAEDGTLFLFGTDHLGHDLLSRLIYGTRISLTVGLLGIAVSFTLGIILGGISGYFGGWIDNLIQRLIEMLHSFQIGRAHV